MENILIDTDIVIEYLRSKNKPSTLLVSLLKRHQIYLSSITEFELFLGAKTDKHKEDIKLFFSEIEVLPFSCGCGQIATNIWQELKNKHQHAEVKDIFIATIAIYNGFWLCSFNKKHFKEIERVKLWDIDTN